MGISSVGNIASRMFLFSTQDSTSVVVRPGDTLGGIAKRHHLTLENLLDANPHKRSNPNLVRPGEVINLPNLPNLPPSSGQTQAAASSEPSMSPAPRQASDMGTDPLSFLRNLTALFASHIPAGDRGTPQITVAPLTYTVAPGDTVSTIAQRAGVTEDALHNANDLHPADDRHLQVGKELRLPEGASSANQMAQSESITTQKNLTSNSQNTVSLQSSNHRIGTLSAKYESGTRGTHAIGWDATGGTSYGKYQINSKTMENFIVFIKDKNPEIHQSLHKLKHQIDGGKNGPFAEAWTFSAACKGDGPSLSASQLVGAEEK